MAENRRFYLVAPDGRLFSGIHYGPLVQIRPDYDPEAERLALRFPDGALVEGQVRLGEPLETDFWGDRSVRGRLVEGPWANVISRFVGKPLRLVRSDRPGGAFDAQPVSLVSRASVEELARQAGRERLDGRRFRMLIGIDGCTPHEEDTWIDRRVQVGEALLRVTGPCSRCATTTRDPSTGLRDLDTLRVIWSYRGLREGRKADFGVYAGVERPGRVRVGDAVVPEEA